MTIMTQIAPCQLLQYKMNYPPKIQQSHPPSDRTNLQSSQKRYQFYKSIKQCQKQKIFQQVRRLHIEKQSNQTLAQLISKTNQQININQLSRLIGFAQVGMNNAVIHIGNLFIDRILDYQVFQVVGTEWLGRIPGGCGNFQWLLSVLISRNIVDLTFVTYLGMVKSLFQTQVVPSDYRILNSFKCIVFLLRNYKNTFTMALLTEWKSIKFTNLLSYTNSANYQLSKQCYILIGELLSQQDDSTMKLIQTHFSHKNIISVIKAGILSVHSFVRALSCQIFNNTIWLLKDNCKPAAVQELFESFCNLLNHEKEKISVKIEVSYLMVNYLASCSLEEILDNIVHGVAKCIKELASPSYEKQTQIHNNFMSIRKYLNQLCFRFQINESFEQQYIDRISWQLSSQGLLMQDYQI